MSSKLKKSVGRGVRFAQRRLSPEQKKHIKRIARSAARYLPESLRQQARTLVRPTAAPRKRRGAERRVDPWGLAVDFAPESAGPATGRAAAATSEDPRRAERLATALRATPIRAVTQQRVIAGIFGADLKEVLVAEGYAVEPLNPGTAIAVVRESVVESVVIDLAGMTHTWSGALTASGSVLFSQLKEAIRRATARGVSVWVVCRGPEQYTPGAVALRLEGRAIMIDSPRQRQHETEDPGNAPHGIASVVRKVLGYDDE